ncbi:MAG: tetratricopeptide repeat protein [Nitrospirae bacterium]|nr:tetratricopeptide repeat protein [Nitrospirota bacterium]
MSSRQLNLPDFTKTNILYKTPVHIILIIIIGVITYSNTFQVPFYFDDYQYIIDSPFTKSFEYFTEPLKALPVTDSLAVYTFKTRAIGFLTFAVNYKLYGFDVAGYHIVNLSIHIINALLVYWLVLLTFFRGAKGQRDKVAEGHDSLSTVNCQQSTNLIAFFSALLFLSHPIQTQAVTYISQRFASLATLFYLLSLVLYVKWRIQNAEFSRSDPQRRPVSGSQNEPVIARSPEESRDDEAIPEGEIASSRRVGNRKGMHPKSCIWYLGSVLSAVFAMKTKEIAFTIPIIITLYEFFFFSKPQPSTVNCQPSSSRLTPYALRFLYLTPLLLTMLIIPLSLIGIDKPADSLIGDITEATRAKTNISRWDYLFTEFRVIVTYLRLLFLPVNQNLDHDYPVYNSFLNPNVFLSFLILLGIFGLAVYLFYYSKKSSSFNLHPSTLRLTAFGIFWFFITLSVESSIIPTQDIIFEHRLYLPSIGLIIGFVSAVFYVFLLFKSRRSLATCYLLLTTILVTLSIASYQRNSIWQDKIAFWGDVVKKSPKKIRGYNELALAYMENGKLSEAVSYFRRALTIDAYSEYSLDIYLNLANALDELGYTDDAIITYKKIIALNYGFETAHYNLGILYYQKSMFEEAAEEFKIALSLNPLNYDAKRNLELLEFILE